MEPRYDALQTAMRVWAEAEAARETVRIPPGLLRLKARLAADEARQAKARAIQRETLGLAAVAAVMALLLLHPHGATNIRMLGMSILIPFVMAPLLFVASLLEWIQE